MQRQACEGRWVRWLRRLGAAHARCCSWVPRDGGSTTRANLTGDDCHQSVSVQGSLEPGVHSFFIVASGDEHFVCSFGSMAGRGNCAADVFVPVEVFFEGTAIVRNADGDVIAAGASRGSSSG